MWWGLLGGLIVGYLAWDYPGAAVLGFFGFLGGVIVDSRRKRPRVKVKAEVERPLSAVPAEERIALLEARVAQLEARLSGAAVIPVPVIPRAEAPEEPAGAAPVAQEARASGADAAFAAAPQAGPSAPAGLGMTEAGPSAPAGLGMTEARRNPLIAWITGGNAIARVGVIVLFIGIAFLLRHAVQNDAIPVAAQMGGVALVGAILLGIGWRLRASKPGYSLSLQGAGVGILYLAIYGAFRLHNLIGAEVAFPLLVAVAAGATFLAIRQDSAVLASFGAVGGFLAPVLASTGQGDHVLLFSYYAVLNLAVLATAWFRGWRSLNLIGFAFTFVIGALWGTNYYRPEYLATVEPFLVFFFYLYVAVAILFARHVSTVAGRMVDGTIVFGVPIVAFSLQAGLLGDTEHGLTITSAAMAVTYAVVAYGLRRRNEAEGKLLEQAFWSLAIVFATLTIPFALDARWTSAAWALEGAAVAWFGAKQRRRLAVPFGVALQIMAGMLFLVTHADIPTEWPIANGQFLGALLIAAGGLATHLALKGWSPRVAAPLFAWALAWWYFGAAYEAQRVLSRPHEIVAMILIAAGTAVLFAPFVRRAWRDAGPQAVWREAAWPSGLLLPALALALVAQADRGTPAHPFAEYGWFAWPFAIAAHLLARRWIESPDDANRRGWTAFNHWGLMLIAVAVVTWEAHWQVIDVGLRRSGWLSPLTAAVPALAIILASSRWLDRTWPLSVHTAAYLRHGAFALAFGLWVWVFAANFLHNGRSNPWPYMPLLNSVDLVCVVVAVAFATWIRGMTRRGVVLPRLLQGPGLAIASGLAAFAWANGMLLRSLHHWADVPYRHSAWKHSFIVQASLSVFWASLALALMVYATRKAKRAVWMVGAGLLGVVAVKLLVVDLANLSGLERIVSFIGVGVVMLVIGYLAPAPPRIVIPNPEGGEGPAGER